MTLIQDISEIRMGATFRGRGATRLAPEGSFQLVRIGDISQDGGWLTTTFDPIEPTELVRESLLLRRGDVLFPNRGVRTTAVVFDFDHPRTLAGTQFFVLRPNTARVHPAYLAWFLRSEAAARHFDARRKGSYVQIIERGDLADLEIPLPPLTAQHTITEAARLALAERDLAERIACLSYRFLNRALSDAAVAAAARTTDGGTP